MKFLTLNLFHNLSSPVFIYQTFIATPLSILRKMRAVVQDGISITISQTYLTRSVLVSINTVFCMDFLGLSIYERDA